jgi:hypothetical protein
LAEQSAFWPSLYAYDPESKSHTPGGSGTIRAPNPGDHARRAAARPCLAGAIRTRYGRAGRGARIIRGGARFLERTEFVIAEVNVIERYPGSYTFAEFVAAMDRAGFRVCDSLDITRSTSTEVKYLDLVFRKKSK